MSTALSLTVSANEIKTDVDSSIVCENHDTKSREAELIGIITILQQKIEELELRLKKYTNGENHKRYYEKNKNKIKEMGSTYLKNLKENNPEKIKEYSKNAYMKKKQKKELEDALLLNNIDVNTKSNVQLPAAVLAPVSVPVPVPEDSESKALTVSDADLPKEKIKKKAKVKVIL